MHVLHIHHIISNFYLWHFLIVLQEMDLVFRQTDSKTEEWKDRWGWNSYLDGLYIECFFIMKSFKWDTIYSCSLRGRKTARGQSWMSEKNLPFTWHISLVQNCLEYRIGSIWTLGFYFSKQVFDLRFSHKKRIKIAF